MRNFEQTIRETLAFFGKTSTLSNVDVQPSKSIEICFDLDNSELVSSWYNHKDLVYDYEGKLLTEVISKFNLVKCTKKEATHLFMIGNKDENGCFIQKKYKNIWCKLNK